MLADEEDDLELVRLTIVSSEISIEMMSPTWAPERSANMPLSLFFGESQSDLADTEAAKTNTIVVINCLHIILLAKALALEDHLDSVFSHHAGRKLLG